MASPEQASNQPVQPALSDLLIGYLRGQGARQAFGLGNAESTGEVVPFEAAALQRVDAELAWREAVAVAHYSLPHSNGSLLREKEPSTWPAPPYWAATVNSLESAAALAFSFGNYPQMVRDLQAFLST